MTKACSEPNSSSSRCSCAIASGGPAIRDVAVSPTTSIPSRTSNWPISRLTPVVPVSPPSSPKASCGLGGSVTTPPSSSTVHSVPWIALSAMT